jgi:hypothetical protein
MAAILILAALLLAIVVCLHKAGLIDLGKLVEQIKAASQPYAPKPLLTANELSFYHQLRRACPEHVVLPQIGMGAIIRVKTAEDRPQAMSARNRFSSKLVDFVICEPSSMEVVCLVELDDRTHDADRDAKRDAITKAAGYATLRFRSRSKPDVTALRAAVLAVADDRFAGTRFH